jgi:hypothetical protein
MHLPFVLFDSDMETQVNMRRCVTDGLDRETVVKNPEDQKSNRNVSASWQIYKKSRCSQRSSGKPWKLIAHV